MERLESPIFSGFCIAMFDDTECHSCAPEAPEGHFVFDPRCLAVLQKRPGFQISSPKGHKKILPRSEWIGFHGIFKTMNSDMICIKNNE
jgi:hypothetical protein